jgi:hypothetical protein
VMMLVEQLIRAATALDSLSMARMLENMDKFTHECALALLSFGLLVHVLVHVIRDVLEAFRSLPGAGSTPKHASKSHSRRQRRH